MKAKKLLWQHLQNAAGRPRRLFSPDVPLSRLYKGSRLHKGGFSPPSITLNRSVITFLERIDLYLGRVRRDLETGDRSQALADCAELSEIARRLWVYLAELEGYSCIEAQVRLAARGEN